MTVKVLGDVDEFIQEVLILERPQSLVVVDFYATWCEPCKQFAMTFEVVANRLCECRDVKFVKMDVELFYGGIIRDMGIRSVPTTALYIDGKLVDTLSGSVSESALEEFVTAHLD